MKIPLEITRTLDENKKEIIRIMATATIMAVHGKLAKLYFIIDTGSPYTIIGEGDSQRLGIQNVQTSDVTVPLGGGKYELYQAKISKLLFITDQDTTFSPAQIDFPIAKSTKRDRKSIDESGSVPSLLGMDFLDKNGFILYANLSNNTAFLERKES